MAQQSQQYRISQLAKDFGIKSKEILDIFEGAGLTGKTHSAILTPDEFSMFLWKYSEHYQISNIDDYLDGKISIQTKSMTETAKAATQEELLAAQKAAEEARAKAEAEAKAKAEEDRKKAQEARAKAEAEAKLAAARAERDRARPENRSAQDRFTQRANLDRPAPSQQPRQQRQAQPPQTQNQRPPKYQTVEITRRDATGEPREKAQVKDNTRVVDTKGISVDLSKYDEKLYRYVPEDKQFSAEKQKLKKQDNRSAYGNKRSEKDRLAMERLKKIEAEKMRKKQNLTITVGETITVNELALRLKKTSAMVIKKLVQMGVMATVNQEIDFDTAFLVADEMGIKANKEVVVTIEDRLFDEAKDTDDTLVERAPVVCVMGHVDHGKTSLLDAIRHTNVTAGEAGGITQHIGAYCVNVKGKDITFLDTPGHAAFTAMRARGAKATDIAILVVAGDDGIMPQTVEAINHAKAAGVEIIVAINKMDKPGSNADAVKQELTKYDLVPEEWGGDIMCVPVSAITKMGIDKLLESILLLAEVKEYRANPARRAKGVVIEAKLDKGRGSVATVLVQNGTLHAGDIVIAGTAVGRVRAMYSYNGQLINTAGPSVPVEIIGLAEVPSAGDEFNAVEDEKMARTLAEQRRDKAKEAEFKENAKVNLEDLFAHISEGVKDLNIIVKSDVDGSAEAVKASLLKLSNEEVRVNVIHSAAGGVTEGDVMLAAASNALIVGFNVRPDKAALDSAERNGVDIRTYRIIYECIEEIEAAMKGMLAPQYKEVLLGHAQVRQTIRVPNVGTIAGSYVQDGKITRNSQIRIVRDGVVVFEDKIGSLRRFKDDVKEVAQGYECGIGLERFNDIKENDILEAYIMEEVAR